MKRKIVITGGAGYVGWHLCNLLLKKGYEVVVLDALLFGDAAVQDLSKYPGFVFEKGDVRHIGDLARTFVDAYAIIHLAAVVGDPACGKNPDYSRTVNIEATKALVEMANYYKVERLLFASSCSVYGAAPADVLLNEGSYKNPVSDYAESRILSEEIIFSNAKGPIPTALRLATVFGYSKRMRFDLAVNIMTLNALTKGKIFILGGKQYRPFVHCQDAAKAFLLALEADPQKIDHEAFNVGSDSLNYQILELGTKIAETLGVEIEQIEEREDDRNYRVDFSKIEWILGFKTKREIAESVLEIKKVFKSKGFKEWADDKYYNVRYDYML
jgi:nucleoside-diphosphate-sugar epimerase